MGTKKDSAVYDVAIYCRLSKEDEKEDDPACAGSSCI